MKYLWGFLDLFCDKRTKETKTDGVFYNLQVGMPTPESASAAAYGQPGGLPYGSAPQGGAPGGLGFGVSIQCVRNIVLNLTVKM